MRRLGLGVATVAIAATAACSALGKQAFQQPVVQLKDVTIQGIGLTGGNLAVKLNVFNPMMAYNFLQSVRLIADACQSFNDNCAVGI